MSELVEVARFTPTQSVCTWHYYGSKWCSEVRHRLEGAGITPTIQTINNDVKYPWGTGPGGRVRSGDGMRPKTYIVSVPEEHAERAKKLEAR